MPAILQFRDASTVELRSHGNTHDLTRFYGTIWFYFARNLISTNVFLFLQSLLSFPPQYELSLNHFRMRCRFPSEEKTINPGQAFISIKSNFLSGAKSYLKMTPGTAYTSPTHTHTLTNVPVLNLLYSPTNPPQRTAQLHPQYPNEPTPCGIALSNGLKVLKETIRNITSPDHARHGKCLTSAVWLPSPKRVWS